METEVRAKSHCLQWTWICNGDHENFMNKIIDEEAALYNHSQTPDCVEKGVGFIIITFFQIVDPFHFPNHTYSSCKERYNSEQIRKDHPHWNITMMNFFY